MSDGPKTLQDYLQVVRRRKRVILATTILVPILVVVPTFFQQERYSASASVLLSHDDLGEQLLDIGQRASRNPQELDRILQNQADLARSPDLIRRVLNATGLEQTVREFRSNSSVSPKPSTDILRLSFMSASPQRAVAIANAYAAEYAAFRQEADSRPVTAALADVRNRLDALEAEGRQKSALYTGLAALERKLQTLEPLRISRATVTRPAEHASKLQPQPVRNGALGVVLGLILGIAGAFLFQALDTRIRSVEEVSERLGLQLLGRITPGTRRLQKEQRLAMLDAANPMRAEEFRLVQTNLDFANLRTRARSLMLTNALPGEGESTTAANLAVGFASTGRHVVLADLNLRQPSLANLFRLDSEVGFTHVALGHCSLEDALVEIPLPSRVPGLDAARANDGLPGRLEVLAAGPTPLDPGALLSTRTVARVLRELERRADLTIVVAPPLLAAADALAISAQIEALIVIVNMPSARGPALAELRRALAASPALQLGFVATGVGRAARFHASDFQARGQRPPVTLVENKLRSSTVVRDKYDAAV